MATTTLMPLNPALSPERVSRVLTISADLLPDEVVAARRARRTRGWMLAVAVLVLAGIGGWYVRADHELRLANDERTAVTDEAAGLQRRQSNYSEVVNVQAETATITEQVSTLLANDLPWATLIDRLRDAGTGAGVAVDGISGSLNATAGAAGTVSLPSISGVATIGTVTLTGTAPDKPSVAKYVDTLATVTMVANPYVTSVAQTEDGDVQFSLTVDVTAHALCGRFTTACKTTGGN